MRALIEINRSQARHIEDRMSFQLRVIGVVFLPRIMHMRGSLGPLYVYLQVFEELFFEISQTYLKRM